MRKKVNIVLALLILVISACNKDIALPDEEDTKDSTFELSLIETSLLDIAEPSGLSWDLYHNNFIVVDDNTNKAYIIDKSGKTISPLKYDGDDTEGITINANNHQYWLAEEALSKLIVMDSLGNQVSSYDININRTSTKKGLEGLSYNSYNKTFYILNEAEPGLLIKWNPADGIISQKELHFAKDYSGIYADNADQSLWIVSDQSQKLYFCNNNAEVIQSFDLGFEKAEGIVADIDNERIYIVSDSQQKLYTYKITKQ
jgi:uncharacterized protein YjiK